MSRIADHAAAWDEAAAQSVIDAHLHLEGALIPMLHALQEQFGYVPPETVPMLAKALNISRAEVHGTITFYHDFHTSPGPAHVVKFCRAEACRANGSEEVVDEFTSATGLTPGQARDGVMIQTVYCLGNCALGPSAMVGEDLHGRVDATRLAELCGLVAAE